MSFPMELVVIDTDPGGVRDVHVQLSASGTAHELHLTPRGEGELYGRLSLPDAPRYLRIEATCTTSTGSEPCMDEVLFMSSTASSRLEFQLFTHDGHTELLSTDSSGYPLWLGFSWGALLLVVGLLGLIRARSHA